MKVTKSQRRILYATSSALLAAVTILVIAVLPAEYGWDPLGSGEMLGLVGMSDKSDPALYPQPRRWDSDRMAFELAPFEAVEYKYRLEKGAAMVFSWRASNEVLYEMHSEPDGVAPGYAESFAKDRDTQRDGSYTAPFSGIHGWFWQNRGAEIVMITLQTSGFYSYALEMREGRTHCREIGEGRDQCKQLAIPGRMPVPASP